MYMVVFYTAHHIRYADRGSRRKRNLVDREKGEENEEIDKQSRKLICRISGWI